MSPTSPSTCAITSERKFVEAYGGWSGRDRDVPPNAINFNTVTLTNGHRRRPGRSPIRSRPLPAELFSGPSTEPHRFAVALPGPIRRQRHAFVVAFVWYGTGHLDVSASIAWTRKVKDRQRISLRHPAPRLVSVGVWWLEPRPARASDPAARGVRQRQNGRRRPSRI